MFYRILIALLMPMLTWAQSSISGKIVDANYQPVAQAQITIVEQNITFSFRSKWTI